MSKASLHTIAGVCSAIGALVAAIADPEPFTKCGLIATGVGAIAYTSLIPSMPSEEKIKLQAEQRKLRRHKTKIEDLLAQLK